MSKNTVDNSMIKWYKKKTLLETYRDHSIWDIDGSIVITPVQYPEDHFFLGMDDSKRCGHRVWHEEWNTVETARKYLDVKI